jgi:phosphoenolpyruvate carboxykinase (ATP)
MPKSELFSLIKKAISNAKIIYNPSLEQLRALAKKDEQTTEFGSPAYVTKVRNRSAKFTEIFHKKPTEAQMNVIKSVVRYLNGKTLDQREIFQHCNW